ncbi:nucleotidyltransferase domain-containing protein [Clostridium sp. D2Q-11]|uniref:Nucleotidyltransferase domain-containing protein n=1 Tax=Anaeromonas frigoriresistens TaxID=2683708 RepID=A0A942UTG9_9FIRM|nr:nucleotidyltransferase domain-containing protein [Anaeromonas frigoriresistens]MBS4537130.1 nucleotidyltransferase domain-containing protein [Anaeromonas frigoriresistens]
MYNEYIEEVKKYLINKYKVHTIVLYGSYAKGNFTDESDIDILCFYEGYEKLHDSSIIMDKQLDAWIYPITQSRKARDYIHIHGGQLILDNRYIGERLLNDIEEEYNKGPKIKTDEEKEHLRNWLNKMNERTKKRDIEGNFRYHWMLKDSIEIYFNIKDMWYLGPKESLKWLYFNDEKGYDLFSKALKIEASEADVDNLIKYIISL